MLHLSIDRRLTKCCMRRSTAHLMAWPDSGLDAIGQEFGAKTASLLVEAQRYAIQTIEQVPLVSAIDTMTAFDTARHAIISHWLTLKRQPSMLSQAFI